LEKTAGAKVLEPGRQGREGSAALWAADERIAALSRLETAERNLRRIGETLHEGIWVIDEAAVTTFVNPRMAGMLGYAAKEMIGRPMLSFVEIRRREDCESYLRLCRQQGAEEQHECVFLRKGNEPMTLLLNMTPVFDDRGGYLGAVTGVTDISERRQLEQALRSSYEQLRQVSQQLVKGDEIQRKRLASELHDQVGQNLTALGIHLNILRNLLAEQGNPSLLERIDESLQLIENTGYCIRDVMANLRPFVLDDYGLPAALSWFGQRCQQKTGLKVTVTGEEALPRPEGAVETSLYRIVQEAVHNVVKHARASRAHIHIGICDGDLVLTVEDNGRGFDRSMLEQSGIQAGWGLLIMKERALSIGAEFDVHSRPGRGTLVTIKVAL